MKLNYVEIMSKKITEFPVKILLVHENEIYFIGSYNELRVYTLTPEILGGLNAADLKLMERVFRHVRIANDGFYWSNRSGSNEIYFDYHHVYHFSKILLFDEMLIMLQKMKKAKKIEATFVQKVITALLK
ncbi:MAG TPA: hypothetical protein DCQ31_05780 [Bacteroidales bacterium]|nr:hypothetical protein [Bacteroidales bacterium]